MYLNRRMNGVRRDREGGCVLAAVAFLLIVTPARAEPPPEGPSDWELATVLVGKDHAREVETKLGHAPCLLPSSSGDTLSYLYNITGKEGALYLRFVITDRVTSMTLSKDPPIAGVCYGPAEKAIPPRTGKGVELGATMDDVTRLYGRPTESFSVGPLTRYRYVTVAGLHCEWDLVFRNKRLAEWTVALEE